VANCLQNSWLAFWAGRSFGGSIRFWPKETGTFSPGTVFHRWIVSCRRSYGVTGPCRLGIGEVILGFNPHYHGLQEVSNNLTAKPENKTTLPKVLLLSMLPHFMAPIIPRLFLVVFRYAQPVLISTAIRSMSKSSSQSSETGRSVILMAVIVYVGLAVGMQSSHLCAELLNCNADIRCMVPAPAESARGYD
jgi:hypothetical protein